jgi:hypothetical protein
LPIAPQDTPYFVHIGASNPIAESRSTFSNLKIFQQVDVLGNGFGNIFEESLVKDDFAGKGRKMTSAGFDLTSIDATQWVPMVVREDPMTNSSTKSLAAPPTMGFDNVLGAKQGQWFTGKQQPPCSSSVTQGCGTGCINVLSFVVLLSSFFFFFFSFSFSQVSLVVIHQSAPLNHLNSRLPFVPKF